MVDYSTTPRLLGKVAVVSGAGRGIGAATARAFARAGARVCLADIDAASAGDVTKELAAAGFDVFAHPVDIADPASVKTLFTALGDRLGACDILINNAGINVARDPMKMTGEDWARCMSVDLEGVWHMTRAALEMMIPRRTGSVVNIASVHSHRIIRDFFPYPVAKHAVLGMTRALATQYAIDGIRVNAIAPGYIDTQIVKDWIDDQDDPAAKRAEVENLHPPGRIGQPEEIAMTAVFLGSDEAPFLNGECIFVDGGRSNVYHD